LRSFAHKRGAEGRERRFLPKRRGAVADNKGGSQRLKLSTRDLTATLSALRALPSVTPDADKRTNGRIDVEAEILVTCLPADGEPMSLRALLRNLSPGGIGLLMTTPLREGQDELIACLPQANSDGLYICCRVLHCHSVATSLYRIGAVFDAVLSEQTAMMVCPGRPAEAAAR
jgi:hypothetical protein